MKMEIEEALLMKVILDEANEEERNEVENWRSKSPENAKQYADLELIWKSSNRFVLSSTLDENEAWIRFKQRIEEKKDEGDEGEKKPEGKVSLPSWLKVAASVVLIGIGLWLSYTGLNRSLDRDRVIIVQALDEARIDTLSDGSIITLNKNSKLSYPKRFAKNERMVTLEEGEAFFNIAPNVLKPFIVQVNEVSAQVVGTSFNIRTKDDDTELIVETGIVEVSKKNVVIRLRRNEMVSINKSSDRLEKKENRDQLYKYYRSKEFIVDNTPLWRLVEVLNEAYDAQITIGEKSLENITLNTTFKNKSLDAVLTIICQTLKIEADKNGEQIILHN